jgi:hypothetical protein
MANSLWDTITGVGDAVYDWGADAVDDVVEFFGYDSIASTGISADEYAAYYGAGSYTASFLDDIGVTDAWDYISNTATEAWDWVGDSGLGKAAGAAATSLYGAGKTPTFNTPKGARQSGASRTSGTAASGGFRASAADFGFTPQVQRAMQSAINSNMGYGSLEQAIAMLKGRRTQGPFLQLEQPTIRVKSRAKEV